MKPVYESNGQPVGDGDRITRVEDDGKSFSVMVDAKTRRFAKIKFVDEVVSEIPTPSPEPTPIPPASPNTGTAYVAQGGPAGDGTFAKPFPSIDAAIGAGVKGGNTILLTDGNHGALNIKSQAWAFSSELNICAQNPYKATITGADFSYGAKNVALEDMVVIGGLRVAPDASHIKLRHNRIQSYADVSDLLTWTAEQWKARTSTGIQAQAPFCEVSGNELNCVSFGIVVGTDCVMQGNRVTNACGDALRAFDRSVVEGNYVGSCFQVDGNHADGFQSFPVDGRSSVTGLVLRNNTIEEWTHTEREHPLRANLQGLGLFDGWFDGLVIEGNRVLVSHWHGITVAGTRDALINGNTVTRLAWSKGQTPWIMIAPHKNGQASQRVTLTNNTAPQYNGKSGVVTDTGNKIA